MVRPRIVSVPRGNGSLGDEAVAFAREHGLDLDDWQAYVLSESMKKKGDRWAAYEVGVTVPRQNGKGTILEARELAELYLVKSELTIHSAHLHDTSLNHLARLWSVIEANEDLLGEVKPSKYGRVARWTTGQEGIRLTGGRSISFRTRTAGGARGFSCDLLVLDEAMFLPEAALAAGFFTTSARENPQVWYTGSAVDQLVHTEGVVFSRVRERGVAGEADLAYFEWSVEGENPSAVPLSVLKDRAAWAQANPAMGKRIRLEHVEKEYQSLGATRSFAVERAGIGDWPRTDHIARNPIDLELWDELANPDAKMGDPVCLAFDVSPERRGAIAAAGMTEAGVPLVEVVEDRNGTSWMPARLAELVERHSPAAVVCDARGPVASILPKLEDLNVEVELRDAGEHAQACGQLVDIVTERNLVHLGQPELASAIHSASTRPLGDAWAWSRRNSSGNIAPLVAVTLALSAAVAVGNREFSFQWV